MIRKPIIPRKRAVQDVDDIVDHYLAEAGVDVALGFIDQLERAYEHIAYHPASGSPRYAQEVDLPGLRCWRLRRHPHLVFYIERPDHVDVWRILHAKRDIPAWMAEPDDEDPIPT